jgi:hypothetical protein
MVKAPQPKIQPLKLPAKVPLNAGTSKNVLGTSTKSKSTTTLEMSGRMLNNSSSTDPDYRVFEENLPPNCYFKKETREQLPRDPVKLIKLKLIKKQTAINLEKKLKELKDKNRSHSNKMQIPELNKSLGTLSQLIIQNRARLKGVEQEKNRINNMEYNQGRLTRSFF